MKRKTIWFISHTGHHDPRIYHIASVLDRAGLNIVLFDPPNAGVKYLGGAEFVQTSWADIPENQGEYIPLTAVDENVGSFLAPLEQGNWAHLIAPGGRSEYVNFKYQLHSDGAKPRSVVFQQCKDSIFYYYHEGRPGHLYVEYSAEDPLLRRARALLAFAEERESERFSAIRKWFGDHAGYRVSDRKGVIAIEREAGYERGHEIQVDLSSRKIRQRWLPRRYGLGVDDFEGTQFDFRRFKSIVYDYTWMLDSVQDYLFSGGVLPDIVLVSDLPVLPVGVMLKQLFGARLVVDCHEWWAEQHRIWNPHEAGKIAAIDSFERALYAQCDAALTVGHTLAEMMSAHFKMDFHYVPTCVFDLESVEIGRQQGFWQAEAGLPVGSRVALFQGGFSTNRNLENLMRATRYMADDQYLVLCGDGDHRQEMQRVLSAEGSPSRVRFLGWKPQDDLWKFAANADMGIIPYTHDLPYFQVSAPNKLSEYHVCKLPMLVDVRMRELRKVVEDDGIGVVADLSKPEYIGKEINNMLANEALIVFYRENYKSAADRFTPRASSSYLSAILEMVA